MATTPPPQTSVHAPSTPLHGAKFDTYQHSRTRPTTRRSQRPAHTPPAASIASTTSARVLANTYSPPSSADTSPQTRATKRRRGNPYSDTNTGKRDSSPITGSNMDPLTTSGALLVPEQGTFSHGPNMLPTPAKTPRKKDLRKTSELQSAARVLFPSRLEKAEDAMPSKQVRRRKNVGFSLDDSGEDEDANGRIQIFTDSKEKIPELDLGDHNPFLGNLDTAGPPEPHKTTRRSARKGKGHVKTNPHIQDAFNHEEGMVYVFRGKKIFRRFSPDPDRPNLSSEETEVEGSTSPRLRSLTRASVKPRLLFPTEKQRREREFREEEALTDVEDGHIERAGKKLVTPVKQSFGPATPPTTCHATRSTTKRTATNVGSSPLGPPDSGTVTPAESRPRKKTSPFDEWQRTKAGPAGHGKGKKRSAEHLEKDGVGAGNKKTKVNAGV
ncbi:MAG: hypothetical protein Q9181_000904 [Wetmoreana brouardii]